MASTTQRSRRPFAAVRFASVAALAAGTLMWVGTGSAQSSDESPSPSVGSAGAQTVATTAQRSRLQSIRTTSERAAIWGIAPEFTYRFSRYNKLVTAEYNSIAYAPFAAQWDNASTNAGNASVIYLNSTLSLNEVDLVFTVPPSNSTFQMSQVLDAFLNTVADPGTRTMPSNKTVHYLVVGPNSTYADRTSVRLGGKTYPVISLGTNRGEILSRVLGDPNAPPSDRQSFASSFENVAKKYALNTLEEFQANGYAPVYPSGACAFQICTASPQKQQQAAKWRNIPDNAVAFFNQVGAAMKLNRLPTKKTGIGGTTAAKLPPYMVQQPGFDGVYYSPSAGQGKTLKGFASIGLSQNGFEIPETWGDAELNAMQQGFTRGLTAAKSRLLQSWPLETNYWAYVNSNDRFGTYFNNPKGYVDRAMAIYAGGFPNLPSDGFYATQLRSDGTGGFLQGENTYSMTFTLPSAGATTADGTLPPIAEDASGNLLGFWSMTVYQPDFGEAPAPFISQASVLNTAYSRADTAIVDIDTSTSKVTVMASDVGPLRPGTAILFGENAADFGLEPDRAYFVAESPEQVAPGTYAGIDDTTYRFAVAPIWQQELSAAGTPIQQPSAASPNPQDGVTPMTLTAPQSSANPLTYGIVQPVSQLGSLQINSSARGLPGLVANTDGSYTIWLAPKLPEGVPATNWIPTPSRAYYEGIYGESTAATMNGAIQPILRMYYPQAGNQPPSILPCPAGADACGSGAAATYKIPMIINHSAAVH